MHTLALGGITVELDPTTGIRISSQCLSVSENKETDPGCCPSLLLRGEMYYTMKAVTKSFLIFEILRFGKANAEAGFLQTLDRIFIFRCDSIS